MWTKQAAQSSCRSDQASCLPLCHPAFRGCFVDKLKISSTQQHKGLVWKVNHSGLLSSIHTLPSYWALGMSNAQLELITNQLIIFFPCRLPVGRSLNDLLYPSWLQQLLDQVKPLGGFFLEKISFEQPWALYNQVSVPKCMPQHIVTPVYY